LYYLNKKHLGFSLVELLIAMVILSILVSIAIPSYRKYQAKVKVSDALHVVEEYKLRTVQLIAKTGANPTIADILYPEGDNAGYVDASHKTVTATYVDQVYANVVNGSVLIGARLLTSGDITSSNNYVYIAYINSRWYCGTFSQANSVTSSLLPSICNNNSSL
jgi:prepilin-type N-terminal cleavage/methylation domain-containing protein